MNIFNSVKQTRVKKSLFDLTHDVKLSCNMGELVPILCLPTLPGDKFQISGETLVRFAPMLAPMMHRVDVTIHYFFCPNRIIWPNWQNYITGNTLFPGSTNVPPALPQFDIQSSTGLDGRFQRLCDYLGICPVDSLETGGPVTTTFPVNALPFAAYSRIWYEYYRDQNQQLPDSLFPTQLVDGLQVIDIDQFKIHNRAWEHDYFTAALPWAQKGPAVRIPTQTSPSGATLFTKLDGTLATDGQILEVSGSGSSDPGGLAGNSVVSPGTFTKLEVGMGTINDLRKAYKLQEWLEKNARFGTRYKESMLAHFDVNTSDKRLQRPEYITGLKTPVVISEVLNTTGTSTAPQGAMAGHGVAVNSGSAGIYFCEEHGYIMGIMSILPKTAYQQGCPRDFLKTDYLDFGWPEFAHIGEQPININELVCYTTNEGLSGTDSPTNFGYIPRYSEYKFMNNRVAGDFRTTLNFWHMSRIFGSAPLLNESFIVSDPTTRVFAVTEEADHMWIQVLNHVKALRPLPKYGNPGW